MFQSIPFLFAQNAGAAAAASSAPSILNFLPYVAIIALWFYLLVLRPQQKTDRERRALLSAVKKNDKVLTTGGMYGTVVSVDADGDRVMIRIDDEKGIRAAFSKGAIVRIFDGSEKEKDKDKEKAKASDKV